MFRFAPGYFHHTLPDGFFLQVFLSVQALLLSFFGYLSGTAELVLCEVFTYITYRQLFGYDLWGTLWRLAVVALTQVAVMVVAVIIVIYFFGFDDESRAEVEMIKFLLFVVAVSLVVVAVTLYVTHRINKRTYHNNSAE